MSKVDLDYYTQCITFGGLKGYSFGNTISKKNSPPAYGDPSGPIIVDTHWYKLSSFGPALQFAGGSRLISANSLLILFLLFDEPEPFDKLFR